MGLIPRVRICLYGSNITLLWGLDERSAYSPEMVDLLSKSRKEFWSDLVTKGTQRHCDLDISDILCVNKRRSSTHATALLLTWNFTYSTNAFIVFSLPPSLYCGLSPSKLSKKVREYDSHGSTTDLLVWAHNLSLQYILASMLPSSVALDYAQRLNSIMYSRRVPEVNIKHKVITTSLCSTRPTTRLPEAIQELADLQHQNDCHFRQSYPGWDASLQSC